MVFWRISNHLSLTGEGGLRASGRWHTRGSRIVYCAESPAAALLDTLVHFEIEIRDIPARYRLIKLEAPEDIRIARVFVDDLPKNWPRTLEVTRALADQWLAGRSAPLLRVPSAIVPETFNVLLNPAHEYASRVVVATISDHVIDSRLLR